MTQDLAPYEQVPDIFRERDPQVAVSRFSEVAMAIGKVIEDRSLYVTISKRKHVRIEGWQALGAPLGIFAAVESSSRIEDGERWGYQAHAIAHRMGEKVSAADAECWADEQNWKGKPDFQVRSMAQTRACAKAMRLALGFIMSMAGYEATPAEELDNTGPVQARPTMPKGKPMPKTSAETLAKDYDAFWREARKLGLKSPQVRAFLGVNNFEKWPGTLAEALEHCRFLARELPTMINKGWGEENAIEHLREQHFGENPEAAAEQAQGEADAARERMQDPAVQQALPEEEGHRADLD